MKHRIPIIALALLMTSCLTAEPTTNPATQPADGPVNVETLRLQESFTLTISAFRAVQDEKLGKVVGAVQVLWLDTRSMQKAPMPGIRINQINKTETRKIVDFLAETGLLTRAATGNRRYVANAVVLKISKYDIVLGKSDIAKLNTFLQALLRQQYDPRPLRALGTQPVVQSTGFVPVRVSKNSYALYGGTYGNKDTGAKMFISAVKEAAGIPPAAIRVTAQPDTPRNQVVKIFTLLAQAGFKDVGFESSPTKPATQPVGKSAYGTNHFKSLVTQLRKRLPKNWTLDVPAEAQLAPIHWPKGRGVLIRMNRKGFKLIDMKMGRGGEVLLWIMNTDYSASKPTFKGGVAEAQTGPAQELPRWHGHRVFIWGGNEKDWPKCRSEIVTALGTTSGHATTKPATTTSAPAVDPKVMAILKRLEAAGDKYPNITAKIDYKVDMFQTGDTESRTGKVYYQGPGKKEPAKFRIHFDTLRQGKGPKIKDVVDYAFDGAWLTIRKERIKQMSRYQVAPPGKKVNPLQLGKGPFPVPFGQKADTVIKHFQPTMRPEKKTDPKNTDYIKLTTRRRYRKEFSVVWLEMWLDRKTSLPVKIVAEDRSENITTVLFKDIKTPKSFPKKTFTLPRPPAGWEYHVERYKK